ncbi:Hemolysin, contains CBS domains [Paenibacillus sp. UNCCL117]|uniref:hemolysin family protein n=1 Tax=unclassified Paenibacillus TaxID=185978 RepID=UPI00088F41A4|nr:MULTISPECIES: hemolysin family protein [unclassified Paenibacillus]SDD00532.1 Hemolysin, contains CBS domains [Paenibacillus sp. cl123]SFW32851.1 Hemolysin, contains CBS domains [Paenibacillus sp. UNCCL117]
MSGDPLSFWLCIMLVVLLIGLNGLLAAAEHALARAAPGEGAKAVTPDGSLPAVRAEEGLRPAGTDLPERRAEKHIGGIRAGITLATLGLGWLGAAKLTVILEPPLRPLGLSGQTVHLLAAVLGFLALTLLQLILGDQLPRAYALRRQERVVWLAARPVALLGRLFSPLLRLSNGMTNSLLRLAGIDPAEERGTAHTEDEIRSLMKESNRRGFIANTEMTLVDNIFEFAETNAREIMIPRTDMVCLYAQRSYEENKLLAISEMHTRYPLCKPDKDNIVGFVHIKDLLKLADGEGDMQEIVRPILKVPESMQISALLKLMQKRKTQMVLLIDEFGGTSGLVTFEDIIEEIVGEVQDEFDEERPQIERRSDAEHSIDGRLLIEEVNAFFGLAIETDDYDTIGGWMYSQVEMPPARQQEVRIGEEWSLVIEEVDHLRITRILMIRIQPGMNRTSSN